MNSEVEQAASDLVKRAMSIGLIGSVADLAELQQVNHDLGDRLPNWYTELILAFPLCGVNLNYPNKGKVTWVIWSTSAQLRSELLKTYPGSIILERGYINVALCAHGSGNSYFIPADKGENPPLYQVLHSISDQPDEIITRHLRLIATSLSNFFNTALVK